MLRIMNYEDREDLFRYLSSICSRVISNGLKVWAGTPEAVRALYLDDLSAFYCFSGFIDFFRGISIYIPEGAVSGPIAEAAGLLPAGTKPISADGRIGMEIVWRKIRRMREKLGDSDRFYSFDLLEEFLLLQLVETYDPRDYRGRKTKGRKKRWRNNPYVITTKKAMSATARALLDTYDLRGALEARDLGYFSEEDFRVYAGFLARTVHRLDQMNPLLDGPMYESLYFRDFDCMTVFGQGLVEGIRSLVAGKAREQGLPYTYEDVTGIFTGIDLEVPLALTGLREDFDFWDEERYQARLMLEERIGPAALALLDAMADEEEEELPFK